MPTTTPLTDAINALTTYANETTGASDTNLSSAVATLVAGYGGGGSGWTADGLLGGTEPSGALVANNVTTIMTRAMQGRTGITSVSSTSCTQINSNAFASCTGITSVYFPNVATLFDYCFDGCSSLTVVAFPSFSNAYGARQRVFGNCTSLTTADLGDCPRIQNQAFSVSPALRTLILRKSSVVTLDRYDGNILGGIYANPTASTIYVPNSLVSTYQTTGNWASFYNAGVTFTKIEGTYYETHYADGTPIE